MSKRIPSLLAAVVAMGLCGAAQAHPGHGDGLMAGVLHPLTGIDHLLAMVAVGLWAAQLGGRARWLVPASFVAVMAASAALAMSGLSAPMIEGGIATSLLVLGLLICFAVAMPTAIAAALVGVFAFFHGFAHGLELPHMASPTLYAAGFVAATIVLHVLGLGLGMSLRGQQLIRRVAGVAVAVAGVALLAA